MQDFLHALLQFPTVFFSGLLALSLLYWVLIIVGAADLNPFDGLDGADGAVKGAVEGAVKGAAHGLTEGAGAVKGVSAVAELLSFFGLTRVPVTISFSLFSLFGWFLSLSTRHALDGILPGLLAGLAAGAVGLVGGLGITGVLTRPLAGLFKEGPSARSDSLVGKVVTISTERADHGFGQGEIDNGAGGITVSVRTAPGVTLKRGDEALIVEVDPASGLYHVEPHKDVLRDEKAAFEAAALEGRARVDSAEPVPTPAAPASTRNRT